MFEAQMSYISYPTFTGDGEAAGGGEEKGRHPDPVRRGGVRSVRAAQTDGHEER